MAFQKSGFQSTQAMSTSVSIPQAPSINPTDILGLVGPMLGAFAGQMASMQRPSPVYASPVKSGLHNGLSLMPNDVSYPSITNFLSNLEDKHPERHLSAFASKFTDESFYNIDEIADLDMQTLQGPPFAFKMGDAKFLLAEVKKEMKYLQQNRT
jgi:hypothetical protein